MADVKIVPASSTRATSTTTISYPVLREEIVVLTTVKFYVDHVTAEKLIKQISRVLQKANVLDAKISMCAIDGPSAAGVGSTAA